MQCGLLRQCHHSPSPVALVHSLPPVAGAAAAASFTTPSTLLLCPAVLCSIDESLRKFEEVMAAAKQEGLAVRGYVSCVVGCPYQVRQK